MSQGSTRINTVMWRVLYRHRIICVFDRLHDLNVSSRRLPDLEHFLFKSKYRILSKWKILGLLVTNISISGSWSCKIVLCVFFKILEVHLTCTRCFYVFPYLLWLQNKDFSFFFCMYFEYLGLGKTLFLCSQCSNYWIKIKSLFVGYMECPPFLLGQGEVFKEMSVLRRGLWWWHACCRVIYKFQILLGGWGIKTS